MSLNSAKLLINLAIANLLLINLLNVYLPADLPIILSENELNPAYSVNLIIYLAWQNKMKSQLIYDGSLPMISPARCDHLTGHCQPIPCLLAKEYLRLLATCRQTK
jgi:hypothetical protein